jgi:hypothetical protein
MKTAATHFSATHIIRHFLTALSCGKVHAPQPCGSLDGRAERRPEQAGGSSWIGGVTVCSRSTSRR